MSKQPTVISTFAGCGGSSLGYKWAGYHELLAIDFNDNAVETFKLNFDTPIWNRDIKDCTGQEILDFCNIKKGELDLLDGSPPCQGFSTAGKRNLNDERNDLFKEFVRLITELQPKVFVMENVSGMIKGKYKGKFNEILKTLKDTGYSVKVKLLNAMWYEVPQSRERLIFIGVRNDLGIEPLYPEPLSRVITVKEALDGLGNKQNDSINHVWIDESETGKNTKTYQIAKQAKQGQKYAGQQCRLRDNEPSKTLCKPSSDDMKMSPYLRNSHCHPTYTRTLSVRELARLSSFPDSFMFTCGLEGANRIGNAVMPRFMYHIAKTIKEQILDKVNG